MKISWGTETVVWELWKAVFWVGRWTYLWEKSRYLNRFREAKNQDCPEMNSQEEGEAFWVEIQLRDLEKWWSYCWYALLCSHRKNSLLHLRREINKSLVFFIWSSYLIRYNKCARSTLFIIPLVNKEYNLIIEIFRDYFSPNLELEEIS